jgi:1-acyl-sn-glycerol-3-phosphate acyltransferase
MRLARFPAVLEGKRASRVELEALAQAAQQVARGEQTLLLFPEGHRTRDGSILPFMPGGLRLVFENARPCPVYVVVLDGLWHLRSFSETARGLAGSTARVRILGPYTIPPDPGEWDDFIASLRLKMIQALERLRSPAVGAAEPAVQGHAAG